MITNERRQDMLIGAIEGGSNYWYYIGENGYDTIDKYKRDNDTFSERMWKAIISGEEIPIHDLEDEDGDPIGAISLHTIERGENLMRLYSPTHYRDIREEHDDAITADVWFQYCVLGELVYG